MGEQQGTSFIFFFIAQNAQPQKMVCGFFAPVSACEKGGQSILHHQQFVTSNLSYSLETKTVWLLSLIKLAFPKGSCLEFNSERLNLKLKQVLKELFED